MLCYADIMREQQRDADFLTVCAACAVTGAVYRCPLNDVGQFLGRLGQGEVRGEVLGAEGVLGPLHW